MNTSALTKSAAAVALAALTALGVAACSSGDAKSADAKAGKPAATASATPSSTPKAGVATKLQCTALEAKLMGSAGELQSAMGTLGSGGDPSSALPKLQSFQQQLHTEVGKATDPALKPVAQRFESDYATFVTTVKAASDAYAAKNPTAVQAQAAKLQSQEGALQTDVGALQSVCG